MSYPKQKLETYSLLGGINSKVSAYITGPNEFRDLTNLNFFVPGALSKRPGTTLYAGATVSGRITGIYEFQRLSGASYLIATANTTAYTVSTSAFSAFKTGLRNSALFDFTTFVDRLFACNGQDFFKYDGSNTTAFSLPAGTSPILTGATGSIVDGTYRVAYGYLNDAGYCGPAVNQSSFAGVSGGIAVTGMTTPSGYGISAILVYRSLNGGTDLYLAKTVSAGTTTTNLTDSSVGATLSNDNLHFTLAPRYMEIFNNQLMMGGFSSMLSTLYWSQIGVPEGVKPESRGEFRTNDGDRLTGVKAYTGQLIVSKLRSIHRVTGDNPDNFSFSEVTDQYGFLSDRSIVVFEDRLMGLDSKGIAEYNGAAVKIVSTKMEPTFQTMNLAAAEDNAVGIHFRRYNEVWWGIPCNGATLNNTTVVYDYLADAWTKYEGFLPSSIAVAKQGFDQPTVLYGGYTGSIFHFGASLASDYGAAITCVMKPPFRSNFGQTTEEQFRQYYVNVTPVEGGSSQAIDIRLFKDYDEATIIASRTMYQSRFQSRVDFGIPARALGADIYHVSATLPLTITGYAIASRFQRDT